MKRTPPNFARGALYPYGALRKLWKDEAMTGTTDERALLKSRMLKTMLRVDGELQAGDPYMSTATLFEAMAEELTKLVELSVIVLPPVTGAAPQGYKLPDYSLGDAQVKLKMSDDPSRQPHTPEHGPRTGTIGYDIERIVPTKVRLRKVLEAAGVDPVDTSMDGLVDLLFSLIMTRDQERDAARHRYPPQPMTTPELSQEQAIAQECAGIRPWVPMDNKIDIAHLGKLGEETGELIKILFRSLIQGLYEHDPKSKKRNLDAVQDEISDVKAAADTAIMRFGLNVHAIDRRIERKQAGYWTWHGMLRGMGFK